MRPLTDQESQVFFEKLAKYIGPNIESLLQGDKTGGNHLFRLHNNKIYYLNELLLKHASNLSSDRIRSVGVCFGKFTKAGRFHLKITSLDFLVQFAEYKVWLKSTVEMSFLYGHNVLKSGIMKVSENTPQYSGVVVLSAENVPLGFGVIGKAGDQLKYCTPTEVIVFNQADNGEYLRDEDSSSVFS